MFRRLVTLCFTVVLASVTAAAAQTPAGLNGVYTGTYRCGQTPTNFTLSVMTTAGGEVTARFTFYLPPGTQTQAYTFSLFGQFSPTNSKFSLMPARWESEHPANVTMVGM